ncbi:MAG: sortase [Oscillochloris sp.]|nr:sortase [Oscillochloris sp.]
MLIRGRTKTGGFPTIRLALRREPTTSRQRLFWTLGNLLMLAGVYLLLYVGGVYVQIDYMQLAARGDNDLEAPRSTLSAGISAQQASGNSSTVSYVADPTSAPLFHIPLLNTTAGAISSTLPAKVPAGHTSTVERLVIPSVALDYKVIEVSWSTQRVNGQDVAVWDVAEYAVGQHRNSANPGEGGNVVLAGHVGGYGHVFRDLFYVHPGEPVILYSNGQQFLYVVQDRLIVDEEGASAEQRAANAKLIAPTDHEVVTMITCWPPNGRDKFTQRVVVRAVPFSATPLDTSTEAPLVNTVR